VYCPNDSSGKVFPHNFPDNNVKNLLFHLLRLLERFTLSLPGENRPTPSTPLHQEIPDHPERILLYILAEFPVIPAGKYPEGGGGRTTFLHGPVIPMILLRGRIYAARNPVESSDSPCETIGTDTVTKQVNGRGTCTCPTPLGSLELFSAILAEPHPGLHAGTAGRAVLLHRSQKFPSCCRQG